MASTGFSLEHEEKKISKLRPYFTTRMMLVSCHYIQIEVCILKRMLADLYRYSCDYFDGFVARSNKETTIQLYKDAERACIKLNPAHEVVLRLALSMSSFYYEVMKSPEFALR